MHTEQEKPQEECHCQLDCKEPCLVNWEHSRNCPNMQTPQEECFYVTTPEHREDPCKKEEKLQSQEDSWEIEFNEKFGTGNLVSECPHGWDTEKAKDIKDHIRSNFIAKRDLRKLLEEVLTKFHGGGNGRRLLIELMAQLKI